MRKQSVHVEIIYQCAKDLPSDNLGMKVIVREALLAIARELAELRRKLEGRD